MLISFSALFLFPTYFVISSKSSPRGAYLHIPFCRRRCYYCNFSVKVVGDRPATIQVESVQYTNILLNDIIRTFGNMNEKVALETVYFGGGTPSLLPLDCVERIIKTIETEVGIHPDAEITFEMDPGTFDVQKLNSLANIGINRVSIGIQSFDENILRSIGRPHNHIESWQAIEKIHSSIINNFSIDLISGLPNLNIKSWETTLSDAIKSEANHISIYDLQIEEKTAFYHWYNKNAYGGHIHKRSPLPTEEETVDMYKLASKLLTQNSRYNHYEISNYAKKGYESRHNLKYWDVMNSSYYGFGMSAASFVSNRRFTRPDTMAGYAMFVKGNHRDEDCNEDTDPPTTANELPLLPLPDSEGSLEVDKESQSCEVDVLEFLMLSLRTATGLNLSTFLRAYGPSSCLRLLESSRTYIDTDLAAIYRRPVPYAKGDADSGSVARLITAITEGRSRGFDADGVSCLDGWFLRLTDPDGFLVSNDVISSLYASLA